MTEDQDLPGNSGHRDGAPPPLPLHRLQKINGYNYPFSGYSIRPWLGLIVAISIIALVTPVIQSLLAAHHVCAPEQSR